MKFRLWIGMCLAFLLLCGGVLFFRRRAETPTGQGDSSPSGAGTADKLVESLPSKPPAGPPAEPIDRELDLHGTVVRRDGTPVPSASIAAVTYPLNRSLLQASLNAGERVGPSTRSSEAGDFRLRLRRGTCVALRASAPGFAPVEIPGCQAGQRVRIVLEAGVRLVVHVKDDAGKAFAGASVRLLWAPHGGDFALDLSAVTDDAGRSVFENLPPRLQISIWARHPARVLTQIGITLPETGEGSAELILKACTLVSGRVTDAITRNALPGVKVGHSWTQNPSVLTDADGRFELPFLMNPKQIEELHATAEGYGRVQVRIRDATPLEIQMTPGVTIIGRILDAKSQPVADADIAAAALMNGSSGRMSFQNSKSGPDGRFALTSLSRDLAHTLTIVASGHGRKLKVVEASPVIVQTIDAGDIVLDPSRTVSGRVLTRAGVPLEDVGVSIESSEKTPGAYAIRDGRRTDDLGRFTFLDLSPGSYLIRAHPQGSIPVEKSVVIADTDLTGVDVVIDADFQIDVLVTSTTGTPVTGAVVVAAADGFSASIRTNDSGRGTLLLKGAKARISVGYIPPGPVQFLTAAPRDIVPGAGEVHFALEEAGVVTGTVLSAEGTMLAGADIEVRVLDQVLTKCTSDEKGEFQAKVPASGSVDLVLSGYLVQRIAGKGSRREHGLIEGRMDRVTAGMTGVVIQARKMTADRKLSVLVRAPDGAPVAGASIQLYPHGMTSPIQGVTDQEGRAAFENLPALETTVSATNPCPERPWCSPVWASVTPDGRELTLQFVNGVLTTGRLVDEEGNGISGALIMAVRGKESFGSVTSDASGAWSILIDPEETAPFLVWSRVTTAEGSFNTEELNARPGDKDLILLLRRKK